MKFLLSFLGIMFFYFVLFLPTVHCEGVESTALVVWGQPDTLGVSFRESWTAAQRAIWVMEAALRIY